MQKMVNFVRSNSTKLLVAATTATGAVVGTAGAQTAGGPLDAGKSAVTGIGLNDMVAVGTGAVQQIISDNAKLIIIAMMPVMGFYFLQARVRGLFG